MILGDSHLDSRIERCILMNVIVPKLEYAEVREGNVKLVKKLETVQMAAAKKIPRMLENDEQYNIESRVGNVLT